MEGMQGKKGMSTIGFLGKHKLEKYCFFAKDTALHCLSFYSLLQGLLISSS